MIVPQGYRLERDLLWPGTDEKASVLFAQACDLLVAFAHCRGFDTAVQAGGNVGIWPRDIGLRFRRVYTFEPDPVNFRCLCANAPAENIIKFNAALGADHRSVGMRLRPENIGAHQIEGEGDVPTLRIDDLALRACDLICLDVEGCEIAALAGGAETIERFRPVIAAEDKGVSGRAGDVERYVISRFGYRVVDRVNKDVVLAP